MPKGIVQNMKRFEYPYLSKKKKKPLGEKRKLIKQVALLAGLGVRYYFFGAKSKEANNNSFIVVKVFELPQSHPVSINEFRLYFLFISFMIQVITEH